MIEFYKVPLQQFINDAKATGIAEKLTDEELETIYNNITLPTRGSTGSAGYDFVSPFNVVIGEDNPTVVMPTGIRVLLPTDCFLMIVPRSGLGFKYGISLANTMGVIDSDYFYSDNSGHIMAKFVKGFRDLSLHAGDRMMQGIIVKYLTTVNDSVSATRNGGFGSTGQ